MANEHAADKLTETSAEAHEFLREAISILAVAFERLTPCDRSPVNHPELPLPSAARKPPLL